jgi:glutamate-1-semialdehyde 2,1-aminomutase
MAFTPANSDSDLLARAQNILVGGVNSPVRAFRAVGGAPLIVDSASGSRVRDVNGKEYIDFICSWGALILGHADPDVVAAIADQAARGTSYGITSPLEIELGERICRAIPTIERIRFVTSGTEAAMSAVRLARAFTGRDLILKFEGGYHGHADSFLVHAGSGLATLGISSSPGVPAALAQLTLNAPYNDAAAVEEIFQKYPGKIAAIIVEPVAANMGVVPPVEDFLKSLREISARDGALLIFDEVITGFRLRYGGAQNLFGIKPDLTLLGKIIGGGLPVAAYGGRRDIMAMVAPLGPVYQAGTLAGNPLAMRAGLATLAKLEAPGFYAELARKAARLANGLRAALKDAGVGAQINAVGSLLTLFFHGKRAGAPSLVGSSESTNPEYNQCDPLLHKRSLTSQPSQNSNSSNHAAPSNPDRTTQSNLAIRDYSAAKHCDTSRFGAFFREMLARGILLAPSQYEALFVSSAHSDADIDLTSTAASEVLRLPSQTVASHPNSPRLGTKEAG